MKKISLSAWLFLTVLCGAQIASLSAAPTKPDRVLQAILDKLNTISNIQYQYYRDVNYRSEHHHSELSGSTYLDFKADKNVTGFRFQNVSNAYRSVYNGQNLFVLEEKDKQLTIHKHPVRTDFDHMSFFYNSIVTLRNSLSAIIVNPDIPKTVSDTTINEKQYNMIGFTLKSQTLQNLGGFISLTTQRNIVYRIIADKQNNLPFMVIQTNSVTPEDYVLTRFTNLKINSDLPAETTWHYINYLNDYKPVFKD